MKRQPTVVLAALFACLVWWVVAGAVFYYRHPWLGRGQAERFYFSQMMTFKRVGFVEHDKRMRELYPENK